MCETLTKIAMLNTYHLDPHQTFEYAYTKTSSGSGSAVG